jgi:O-antigen ligase
MYLSTYLTGTLVFAFSFIYLNIPSYAFETPSLEPKYVYYVFALLIAPLMLFKFRKLVFYMASPFSLWVLAEITVNSFGLLYGSQDVVHMVMTRIQYLTMALMFGFAASIASSTASYEGIFRILAITIPVLIFIDFIRPGIFYPPDALGSVIGRAAATFINPTMAGEAMLVTCLLAIPITRLQYRMPLLLLTGAGVIMTFSRGPILVWLLFSIFLLVARKLPKYSFFLAIIAVVFLPLLLAIFKSYLLERQDLDTGSSNIFARLDFFQTHSLNDNSAQERLSVLKAGWEIFLENPILGGGAGITNFKTNLWPYEVNTHNQIVMLAAEQGILGIALWAWLLVLLWRGRYFQDKRFQMVAAVGAFLMSFFTNNMMDNLYWTVTFALVSGRRQA